MKDIYISKVIMSIALPDSKWKEFCSVLVKHMCGSWSLSVLITTTIPSNKSKLDQKLWSQNLTYRKRCYPSLNFQVIPLAPVYQSYLDFASVS